ncbi:hypothetical protein [Inquilinus sp. Marseille-Q2685]|uniref:hypothetical protein n=1 Tax=Inquilinus sp. Marseille-Q2685 TaxID=2866581 RepID=UPI001CE3F878|nr:hypothetical protein [Inquilinus sp. Marseille-Q2685]
MASTSLAAQDGRLHRVLRHLGREVRHVLPPTLFFLVGFNLIVFTQNLVLSEYLARSINFLVATTAALVVGKAVLVADKMPFLRRFDNAPLILPILFKTFVYWCFVFIARLLEAFIHHVADTGRIGGFGVALAEQFSWHRFLFIQTWILVLFLIYTTAAELNGLFGDGELARILFRHRSSDLKQTRRQRIRALVRLSHLTEDQPSSALRDPASPTHRELVGLIEQLAQDADRRRGRAAGG